MICLRFLWSLLRHKWFVFRAGLKVGGIPLWRLIVHDWSKFTPAEFIRYARWHSGDNKNKEEWAKAWLHHQQLSPHHPEHWILSWRGQLDFYNEVGKRVADYVVVLPMPEDCVREFIADLMGASKAYTDSWDIAIWLNREGPKWHLHDETVTRIADVMVGLGYFITDNCDWSWMRGNK